MGDPGRPWDGARLLRHLRTYYSNLLRRLIEPKQFTGEAFTEALKACGVAISMDGKGAWRDNIFVERLWRSIKYEEVYLHAYDSVGQAKAGIALHRFLQRPAASFIAGQADPGRVLLRDAAGDQTGSMSGEHELPTASVVRSSQATPARRRGQLCT